VDIEKAIISLKEGGKEMDPMTIAGWFITPAASAFFEMAKQYLSQRLGFSSSVPETRPLLDEYLVELQRVREDLRRLKASMDEDRIAMLYGALSQLKDASRSSAVKDILVGTVQSFHQIARISSKGVTGKYKNAELRSMAFIGMAASYLLLKDNEKLIAEKMVQAVEADAATAKRWLGENPVNQIISQIGVPCPVCNNQNPFGSSFCNQDGYPLIPGQRTPSLVDRLLKESKFPKSFAQIYQHRSTADLMGLFQTRYGLSVCLRERFPLTLAEVALALSNSLSEHAEEQIELVALSDILHGFALEVKISISQGHRNVFQHLAQAGLGIKSSQDVPYLFLLEEEAPLKVDLTLLLPDQPPELDEVIRFKYRFPGQIRTRMRKHLGYQ
jgi:hypothetical protein